MAYRHGRPSLREMYDDRFHNGDPREAPVYRVVNIVEKRSSMPRPEMEYEAGYEEDQWYGTPRHYREPKGEYHSEDAYPHEDRRHFDEDSYYGNFQRNSPPYRSEGPYYPPSYGRDDLRHQLSSRKSNRPHHFRHGGRGSGPPQRSAPERKAKEERDDHRSSRSFSVNCDRSPARGETHSPSACSGSNTNSRKVSPEREKGHSHQPAQQKHKPNLAGNPTPSSSAEEPPHSSGSLKEKPSASVVKSKEVEAEEEATASMEPKLTPEEDVKARRSEAIQAKALEIEKAYREDCETFRTVGKMLVAKEPGLGNLLESALDKNLVELKDRCLDALRNFVKELDDILEQPEPSA